MKRLLPFMMMVVVACGGQTVPGADAGDAGDAGGDGPIVECHGYCPQPNGSACSSDCDCYEKCLTGKDFGVCEGATCVSNNQCPPQQQCMNGACAGVGCI